MKNLKTLKKRILARMTTLFLNEIVVLDNYRVSMNSSCFKHKELVDIMILIKMLLRHKRKLSKAVHKIVASSEFCILLKDLLLLCSILLWFGLDFPFRISLL